MFYSYYYQIRLSNLLIAPYLKLNSLALLKNGSSSKKAASAVAAPSLKKDFAEKTEKQDGKSVLKKKKGMAWAEDVSSDDSDGEDETVDIKKSKGKGKA